MSPNSSISPYRSIPASAGQPGFVRNLAEIEEVYPRECGAALDPHAQARRADGLSPRVRGSPHDTAHHVIRDGSIPASAGQPSRYRASRDQGWVYPRECGAAEMAARARGCWTGLSPRVRGSPCSRMSK